MDTHLHLLDWKYWQENQLHSLMELALKVKNNRWQYQGAMTGNSLVMIFQKTSTRTRISFEACMTEMSGHAMYIDWRSTNFGLTDIEFETKYISRNAAFIVARLKQHKDLQLMANASDVPVINGCCNLYHPCQALSDLLTIRLDAGYLEGIKLTYVGVYNNVVNSLVSICAFFGVHLTLVCPIRDKSVIDEESRQKLLKKGLLTETLDVKKALQTTEYLYTDAWLDMEFFGEPAFLEEKKARSKIMMPYQLNSQLLAGYTGKIMHDMPVHPGYEITKEVVYSKQSIIFDQAENRLEAQKALLVYLKSLHF